MSSRFPPPRDRSPGPRQYDRRPSSTYVPSTQSSSSYRPANDSAQGSGDRPPPRGPRADSFRGGFTGRGRGSFPSRVSDSWDRDRDRDRDRDSRNTSSTFRREDDRPEWRRERDFSANDRGPSFNRERPYVGRDRSASPVRSRRDSKEAITPIFSRTSEGSPSFFSASNARGASLRGRGRGDWPDRSRGRSSFAGERDRDLFPTRSRSREGWRERDYERGRPVGPDSDRPDRFERRDFDRQNERDTRGRDHDVWQRDPSPCRSSTGHRGASPSALSSISQDRAVKSDYDSTRKPMSSLSSSVAIREGRRDQDVDYFTSRNEPPRREPAQPFQQQTPSAAASGLDYGPPPSAPVATPTPTPNEKPTAKPPPTKPETSAESTSFFPPSGPKADRLGSVTTSLQSARLLPQSEFRAKTDETLRAQKTIQPQPPSTGPVETNRSLREPTPDSRSSALSTSGDRSFPSNVPSGPRAATAPSYKPRVSPVEHSASLASPSTSQQKLPGPESRSTPNVPTGPRAGPVGPPSGPRSSIPSGPAAGPLSRPWNRPQPDFRSSKPSIMNTLHRPHQNERISPIMAHKPSLAVSDRTDIGSRIEPGKEAGHLKLEFKDNFELQAKSAQLNRPLDTEISEAGSDEKDDNDEDEVDEDEELDENYYDLSEKSHKREMELLRARKPLPPLDDAVVVSLLIKIQILGMIAEGLVPEGYQSSPTLQHPQSTLSNAPPSPDETPEDSSSDAIHHPRPRGRPLKQPVVNPIPTPPLEDLPFLHDPKPGRIVFDEPDGDDIEEEAVNMLLQQEFEHDAWDHRYDLDELVHFYRAKYPEWRYDIAHLEQIKKDMHEPTPDPGSPGAQSAASLPAPVERLTGRAARNATEFDIEKAILMSQQSAREEEERREREAASNARPNLDTEAEVPFMLQPSERHRSWIFVDTNSFVPTNLAVELMSFVPPEDDFDDEEQELFIRAYCQTPKKWGFIADMIPDRNYEQCIAHYYLTKNQTSYKEIWRRSQPKRKRGRAATKPRANALLSDMALNEDHDSTPVPVTDSGRPRRAAAPTFGDVPDAEVTAPPPAKRLATGLKDPTDNGVIKGTKGRKSGTATKVRRTKAQMLADGQLLSTTSSLEGSSQKVAPGRARANLAMKPENGLKAGDIEVIAMPSMSNPIASAAVVGPPPQPVVTSYWSVPEVQKFRQLIAYYGRDYVRIADFMKTKSQAMIKNHYTRELGKGDIELEKLADEAEDKRARGVPMGPPPSPIAPPKRKYEATPSMTAPMRSSATIAEPVASEVDRIGFVNKSALVDDFPSNSLSRDASGSIITKARGDVLHHSPMHVPVQPKAEEPARDRPLTAKSLQGPPRGHFQEEPSRLAGNNSRLFGGPPEHTLHHHPPSNYEIRADVSHTQPGTIGRSLLNQSRDSLSHPQTTSSLQAFSSGLSDRTAATSRLAHSRNGSATGPSTIDRQHAADLMALRNPESRQLPFSGPSAQSPSLRPMQPSLAPPRLEAYSNVSNPAPAPAEPPKAAPSKRVDIMGLLNSDSDPPPKRTSTDNSMQHNTQTPPPQTTAQAPSYQRSLDDALHRPLHSFYGNAASSTERSQFSDSRGGYSSSPAPSRNKVDAWADRWDPRQSAQIDRNNNSSPGISSGYSVVPPGSQPPSYSGLQSRESARGLEPRLSMLGRNHAPSPQPQPASLTNPYRPPSAASQHVRGPSLNYAHSPQSGPEVRDLRQQSSMGSLAQSSSSTPVSSQHSRGQHSIDYNSSRLSIQKHMEQVRQQEEQTRRPPKRENDVFDRGSHYRSYIPPPSAPPADHNHHQLEQRDLYKQELVPPRPSQTPQPSSSHQHVMGGHPPLRTYTPPSYSDPRGLPPQSHHHAHNQHAHQHHQSLPQSQSQQSAQHSHQQPPEQPAGQPTSLLSQFSTALRNQEHQQQPPPQGGPPPVSAQQQQSSTTYRTNPIYNLQPGPYRGYDRSHEEGR